MRIPLLLTLGATVLAPTPASVALTAARSVPPPNIRITDRKGNIGGKVLILMYHRTGAKEAYMVRSRDNFKKDLAALYSGGYRPVTMAEYVTNKMDLPPGASPVIFTFDDSLPTQIDYDKSGQVTPNCFVGMWMAFAKEHPDFPVKGTFYANNNGPFGDPKKGPAKIKQLEALGSEIASHTAHHVNMAAVSPARALKEVASNVQYLEARGARVTNFATPYGVYPHSKEWLLKGFKVNGRDFKFLGVVAAGAGPAHSPQSRHLDLMYIPRIQAYSGFKGINWWLSRAKTGMFDLYVQP